MTFVDDEHLDARLVMESSPKFAGMLRATEQGAELRGVVRASADGRTRYLTMALFAIVMGGAGAAILLVSAPSGKINYGFVPLLAVAVFFAALAAGLRSIATRSFPIAVNRLNAVLATALETNPQVVPTHPISKRTGRAIGFGALGLQFAAVTVAVSIAGGPLIGVLSAVVLTFIGVVAMRVGRASTPRLEGTELRAGYRRVDLTQVSDVRARGPLMSLSDGHARVVLSSALGRPETVQEADRLLTSAAPETSAREMSIALVARAVGDVVARNALDETTASALHRPVTMPGFSRPGPRLDTAALAPVGVILCGYAALFALFAVVR